MKLTVEKREGKCKSELSRIRAVKDIPAVFYRTGSENLKLVVKGGEFKAILRTMETGFLPTTIFEIEIDGKLCKAIVREIQYKPTTYDVIHIDFQELIQDRPIEVNIPIVCTQVVDSVGIKLGGFLRNVKRHLKVRCLPKDMPRSFEVSVKDLNIGGSKRVRDLEIPAHVKPLLAENDVLVVIAKR